MKSPLSGERDTLRRDDDGDVSSGKGQGKKGQGKKRTKKRFP
jgi:hypothetical protein